MTLPSSLPFALLVGLVVFAPLAFGTVEPWSFAVLQTGIFGLAFLWLLQRTRRSRQRKTPPQEFLDQRSAQHSAGRQGQSDSSAADQSPARQIPPDRAAAHPPGEYPETDRGHSRHTPQDRASAVTLRWKQVPGGLPAALFLLFVFLQTIPLPAGLIKLLSPAAFDLWTRSLAILPSGGTEASWLTLSLYPYGTRLEWLHWFSWILVYVVVVQILSKQTRIRLFVRIWVGFAFAVAVFGILQHVAGNGKIYWFRALTEGGNPFGPYVNRNHFAGFLELVLPLSAMLALVASRRHRSRSFREWLFQVLTLPHGVETLLAGFAATVMATALFMSLSRGGVLSFLGGMVVSGTLLLKRRNTRRYGLRIVAVALLVVLAVGWIGWEPLLARFDRLRDLESEFYRYQAWQDSLHMAMNFPVVGTGLGTFEQVYPVYKTIPSLGLWDYAHNDYLQFIAETGVVGLALALWFLVSFFSAVLSMLARRNNRYYRLITIGGLGGIVSILLHSCVDFNLHIGANIFLFFVLMGLTVAAASLKSPPARGSLLPGRAFALALPRIVWATAGTAVFLLLAVAAIRPALAELFYQTARAYAGNTNPITVKNRMTVLSRAQRFGPGDFRFAEALAREHADNPEAGETETDGAPAYLAEALRRTPTNAGIVAQWADQYGREGKPARALAAGRRAMELYPMNGEYRTSVAVSLMEQKDPAAALREFGRAMAAQPGRTQHIAARAWLAGLSYDDIFSVVPRSLPTLVQFAGFLNAQKEQERAVQVLRQALAWAGAGELGVAGPPGLESAAYRAAFGQLASLEAAMGRLDDAIGTLSRATAIFPSDAGFRIQLARLYERSGIPYRALEEYRRALEIDPTNLGVGKKMRELAEKAAAR